MNSFQSFFLQCLEYFFLFSFLKKKEFECLHKQTMNIQVVQKENNYTPLSYLSNLFEQVERR